MINSDVYNYINVLDKAADASALRNRIIEDLQRALKNSRYTTLDDKVDSVRLDRINGTVYTDYANYSYRMDRNNVDIDNENVELASNQLKYNGIVQSVNSQFNHLKSAMGSGS